MSEIHYTPKHGSWLDIAEIELNAMAYQCLDRRIADIEELRRELEKWESERNENCKMVDWQFTAEDALCSGLQEAAASTLHSRQEAVQALLYLNMEYDTLFKNGVINMPKKKYNVTLSPAEESFLKSITRKVKKILPRKSFMHMSCCTVMITGRRIKRITEPWLTGLESHQPQSTRYGNPMQTAGLKRHYIEKHAFHLLSL